MMKNATASSNSLSITMVQTSLVGLWRAPNPLQQTAAAINAAKFINPVNTNVGREFVFYKGGLPGRLAI
jgi:hypothetical protein